MKFTEGAFRDWGYELATTEFRDVCITERESWILGNLENDSNLSVQANARLIEPGYDSLTPEKKADIDAEVQAVIDAIGSSHGGGKWKEMVLVDDRIADSIFQQIQTRPQEYSILATLNLNGDYISDAAAAMVGGLGMAPGANIGENAAIFEATHGTAPKHAGLDRINPGSVILSGVMMLEFLGWQEAADLVTKGLSAAIADKQVTYDLARLMEPQVDPVSCSGFAEAIIQRLLITRAAIHARLRRWPIPPSSPGFRTGAADPCVHCGFCLPTCASYRVLASEMDSPRGRIHALKAIEAGDLELDATVASHFDTCLGCYACVSACPSGVRYDQLIEATRPKLNQANQRSSWQTSFRKLLLQVLPYPQRLRALLQPLRAYAGTPLQQPGPPLRAYPSVRARNRSNGAAAAAPGAGKLQRPTAPDQPRLRQTPWPRGAVAGLRAALLRSQRQQRNGESAASQRI